MAKKESQRQEGHLVFFLMSLILIILCLLVASFFKARALLREVVGGVLLLRLERSLIMTHLILFLAGTAVVWVLLQQFMRSRSKELPR